MKPYDVGLDMPRKLQGVLQLDYTECNRLIALNTWLYLELPGANGIH